MENKTANTCTEQPVLYTYREVAKILKIGVNRARQLMKTKSFPSFKLGAKTLVNAQDFNAWLENLAGKEITFEEKDGE